ncbi:uncharacterized protein ARMOST_16518 [Armillaria ostoyae]|uniref:Uncharacterized protein n=1 Tax=Armillaria ostoyae TaxID=47428 RepID=A0A284RWF8_ARMOS|nr:uncharacterized protein ARMOST_16518 [Armillaria ostoyae]
MRVPGMGQPGMGPGRLRGTHGLPVVIPSHKRPISEVETVASTWEKQSRFALAAWEALTMAELAARHNGKGDETFNEAVKGKPKVSKKTKR